MGRWAGQGGPSSPTFQRGTADRTLARAVFPASDVMPLGVVTGGEAEFRPPGATIIMRLPWRGLLPPPRPSVPRSTLCQVMDREGVPEAAPGRGTTSPSEGDRGEDVIYPRAARTRVIRRLLLVVLGLHLLVASLKIGSGLRTGSVALSADGV